VHRDPTVWRRELTSENLCHPDFSSVRLLHPPRPKERPKGSRRGSSDRTGSGIPELGIGRHRPGHGSWTWSLPWHENYAWSSRARAITSSIGETIATGSFENWAPGPHSSPASSKRVNAASGCCTPFVIMGNHFHLAVETPQGNLVAGMHWLQSTFATRFNRLRREHGHLFQGRYKSLFVEEGLPLGQLCHYIHLNPVRAKVVDVAHLEHYVHSSYWFLQHPRARPAFLQSKTALAAAGDLTDSRSGRRSYDAYLEWQTADGPAGTSKAYINLSRGWALGGKEFKRALVEDHGLADEARALESVGAREARAIRWSTALGTGLKTLRRTVPELANDPKSAPWKLALAAWLKRHTDASNGWLALHLHLGTPSSFSHNLTCFHRAHPNRNSAWRRLITRSAA
jgi:putative transposase